MEQAAQLDGKHFVGDLDTTSAEDLLLLMAELDSRTAREAIRVALTIKLKDVL
jgi:hypothetical protein